MGPLIRPLTAFAAQEARITVAELLGSQCARRVAWPRFAVMLVAHENGRSYRMIAHHMGKRDHKGIFYGARRAAELERVNPAFAALLTKLRNGVPAL